MMFIENKRGLTLVELIVTMGIFAFILAGTYAAYITSSRHSLSQQKIAESEMEFEIAKIFLKRDVEMAGYGIADSYDINEDGLENTDDGLTDLPIPVMVDDDDDNNDFAGDPDSLLIMGTALGRENRAAQGWTSCKDPLAASASDRFHVWDDNRENLDGGDNVIYIEPNTKYALGDDVSGQWEYSYPDAYPASLAEGTVVYGINTASSTNPFYAVEYRLGGTPPDICAGDTYNLLRAEDRNSVTRPLSNARPLLACVLNMQVGLGLDNNEDGEIDYWDDGGVYAVTNYTDRNRLNNALRQVRVYLLVQSGLRNSDEFEYDSGAGFQVGDPALGVTGEYMTLTDEQRRYKWRLITILINPLNME